MNNVIAAKKTIQTQKTIQLPFDGTAKSPDEVAWMIVSTLKEIREEKVDIIFPAQWAMNILVMLHPVEGVLALLEGRNSKSNTAYNFTGFKRNGEMGVTATRSC